MRKRKGCKKCFMSGVCCESDKRSCEAVEMSHKGSEKHCEDGRDVLRVMRRNVRMVEEL